MDSIIFGFKKCC